jgi:lycopene cyclase CruP
VGYHSRCIFHLLENTWLVQNDTPTTTDVYIPRMAATMAVTAFITVPLRPVAGPPRLALRQTRRSVKACVGAPLPAVSERVRAFLARAEEGDPLTALQRADAAYARLRAPARAASQSPQIVVNHAATAPPLQTSDASADALEAAPCRQFDVAVAGGTLGIFVALALQLQGWHCAVVEKGRVIGRTQEWNISRAELQTMVKLRLITEEEMDAVIVSSWNPSRIAFAGAKDEPLTELFVRDVLNCGVSPRALIDIVRARFEANGGVCFENASISKIDVFQNCVQTTTVQQAPPLVDASYGAGGLGLSPDSDSDSRPVTQILRARLLVDAMGSFSPIASQSRGHTRPDAVCVTVGSCCEGEFPENNFGDLICSIDPINPARSTQYFWEAFPAARPPHVSVAERRTLRTTYMFAYGPCDPSRPSLAETLDDYLVAMPRYQGIASTDEVDPKRVLVGFFPAWKTSPSKPVFDRIFPIGDSGGLQSPISFGGFGCICRHLPRISIALNDALSADDDSLLTKGALQAATPYLPGLAVTWLFNKFMSCRPGRNSVALLDEFGINKVLLLNMQCMERLGPAVQVPFLQDVVTAGALTKTLLLMTASEPFLALKLIPHIGLLELLEWSAHYISLIVYFVLGTAARKSSIPIGSLNARWQFEVRRAVEAWQYGSGQDHLR